jgi:hypothetical protein
MKLTHAPRNPSPARMGRETDAGSHPFPRGIRRGLGRHMRQSPRGCPRASSKFSPASGGRPQRRAEPIRQPPRPASAGLAAFPRSALRLEVVRPARHRGTGGDESDAEARRRRGTTRQRGSLLEQNRSPPPSVLRASAPLRQNIPFLAVSVHPMQRRPGAPARPVYHDCPVRWTRLRPDRSRIPASGTSGGGDSTTKARRARRKEGRVFVVVLRDLRAFVVSLRGRPLLLRR